MHNSSITSRISSREVCCMLIGNKLDKKARNRCITTDRGIQRAHELDCTFMEVSAETGENVDKAFERMITLILDQVHAS